MISLFAHVRLYYLHDSATTTQILGGNSAGSNDATFLSVRLLKEI